jgi:hypothetical protein
MMPPIEIIVTCRARRDFVSFGAAGCGIDARACSKTMSPLTKVAAAALYPPAGRQ